MNHRQNFDVLVVGGGHAGTEAALAAARAGARTLLLTQSIETLGQMSCNPAIGGIGKGHLVREIDALGGAMGRAADRCGIHFRTLNASRGPAVRATRAQIDRQLYRVEIRRALESEPRLSLFQQSVEDLILEDGAGRCRVAGVVTAMGLAFRAAAVVLTTGTFLGGRIHVGLANYQGGRAGDPPANALAEKLRALPFRVGRLKTGTPPRLDGRTIDYARLEVQPGDDPPPAFSFDPPPPAARPRQVCCHIARTNERTHDVIRGGLDRSPMYSGVIEGTGPRYCPSVEDKVVRFADKASHQVFVEPEGLDTTEVYPNGISTSLPFDVQHDLVRSIEGFENAVITRPGYAIEYDYFDPRDLRPSLETSAVAGLFFAGQLNGTTGYEEAAAQGLVAGLNAARQVAGREPWTPRRDEAYIGVLIDDLTSLGTSEPYRMFTSRAEFGSASGRTTRSFVSPRRGGGSGSWTTRGTGRSTRGAGPSSANGRGSRGCGSLRGGCRRRSPTRCLAARSGASRRRGSSFGARRCGTRTSCASRGPASTTPRWPRSSRSRRSTPGTSSARTTRWPAPGPARRSGSRTGSTTGRCAASPPRSPRSSRCTGRPRSGRRGASRGSPRPR